MKLFPEITITHEDLAVLSEVVRDAIAGGRYAAAFRLGNELHRARVVPASHAPKDCLVLNAAGRYLEERSGAIREIIIVAGKGSPASGAVPVLGRVGSALIGLSEGQRIGWPDPRGKARVLQLLEVRRQPAAADLPGQDL